MNSHDTRNQVHDDCDNNMRDKEGHMHGSRPDSRPVNQARSGLSLEPRLRHILQVMGEQSGLGARLYDLLVTEADLHDSHDDGEDTRRR